MINCKTCNESISKKAKICPKCGEPNTQTRRSTMGCLILIILLSIPCVGSMYSVDNNSERKILNEYQKIKDREMSQSCKHCQGVNFIKTDYKNIIKCASCSNLTKKVGK